VGLAEVAEHGAEVDAGRARAQIELRERAGVVDRTRGGDLGAAELERQPLEREALLPGVELADVLDLPLERGEPALQVRGARRGERAAPEVGERRRAVD